MTEETRHALPKGYELEGYQIEKVLGAGGFGITYLAHETAIGRKVAIKEYLPSGIAARGRDDISVYPISSSDAENFKWGLERFKQEAKTLVTFRHPNIVSVYRYFEANGTAFLVMAYEDGESLATILERAGTLSESEILEILEPLLSGLEHVHKAGFLHRDIKPGNIYIRRDGSPVLLDFGAARQALGGRSQSLTSIVSAGYAPFEQYTTRGHQGAWTDIYAFGGVLYRAVTGERPPDSPDRIRDDPYVPAARIAAGKYSEALLRAIDRALEVDEAKRPQSVPEWRALLEGRETTPSGRPFARYPGRGESARPTAGPSARQPTGAYAGAAQTGEAPSRRRRNLVAAAVLGGALLVLSAAGAGAYFFMSSQNERRVAEYLDRARGAIANGSLGEAERLIADAEKLKKGDAEIERLKTTLKAARDAQAAKAAQARALLARARSAVARRAYDEAEKLIEEAAKLAPDLPELAGARESLRAAREAGAKEEQARALLARAREAIRTRNFDEAQRLIDEAARIAPSLPDVGAARAELAAAQRGAANAATVARLLEEARAAIGRKDFDTARRRLEEAARLAPGDVGVAEARRQLAEAEKAGSTPPDGGERKPVSGITKSPTNLCEPGSMRFVDATRRLPLPGQRYCATADWSVKEVTTDGVRLFWRVVFSDGHVNCQCTRSRAAAPGSVSPVAGVERTPTHLCVAGTQRMVRTTRALALPGERYCSDADWKVSAVTTDGESVFWDVPFKEGVVSCACKKR